LTLAFLRRTLAGPGTVLGCGGCAPRAQFVSWAGSRLRSSLRGCPRLAAAGAWGGFACGQRDQSDSRPRRRGRGPVKPAITRCPRPGLLTRPAAWRLALAGALAAGGGLFIRARYADHAKDWQPELVKVANVALVIALATGISANWSTIKSMFRSWVIVTVLVIIIVAGVLGVLLGLLLGGRRAEVGTTSGLVSVIRFGSLGLIIIGSQLHGNAVYLGPAITFTLVDFVLPVAVAVEIGHRAGAKAPAS
jgi:hypothetical protein